MTVSNDNGTSCSLSSPAMRVTRGLITASRASEGFRTIYKVKQDIPPRLDDRTAKYGMEKAKEKAHTTHSSGEKNPYTIDMRCRLESRCQFLLSII